MGDNKKKYSDGMTDEYVEFRRIHAQAGITQHKLALVKL
jgi:hypothetical protein